jgi:hypothetical protein
MRPRPPAAAVEEAPGNVGFAVAAEIGGQNIDPGCRGAPGGPLGGGEGGAGRGRGPPGPVFEVATAVSEEVLSARNPSIL